MKSHLKLLDFFQFYKCKLFKSIMTLVSNFLSYFSKKKKKTIFLRNIALGKNIKTFDLRTDKPRHENLIP